MNGFHSFAADSGNRDLFPEASEQDRVLISEKILPSFVLLFLLPFAIAFGQEPQVDGDARVGFESIKAKDLREYLTYLASDELQGRETSYAGEHMTAEYIADHFHALGLKPIGDDGSYLQHYDIDLVRVNDSSTIVVNGRGESKSFSWIKDFISFGGRDTCVSGKVVLVGYGDNRGPDSDKATLAGKVIMTFAGSRKGVQDTARAQVMRRFFSAARRDSGALATLIVVNDSGPASYEQIAAQFGSFGVVRGRMSLKGEIPRVGRPGQLSFYISPAIARAILGPNGLSLGALREKAARDSLFSPLLLGDVSVSVNSRMVREQRQAENVVGLLEGSDPVMKNDVVIFSAHFDHLGVGPTGAIYHGADDNGSGTAMVMDLAQAFVENPVRPKCSLLFLAVSGEEKGLLGSAYYTSHPIVPLAQTIADFNTDMIGRMDTTHEKEKETVYTYLIGSDKISTELDSIIQLANRESNNIECDYHYNNEHDPEQFYRRSDHYNFAKNGVPIAFFFTGVHADYHKPTDTVDKIIFDRIVKIGQLVYYAGWKTANVGRMLVKNGTGAGYKNSQVP
jgi:Zn-dependent M28 family amino/carboxypeptidase